MASISHRYSIRWLPARASEPTSTLVLTLESGLYIDIRILAAPLTHVPPYLSASQDALLRTRSENNLDFDWAFAGQSTSKEGPPRQCTWEHWVDSRTNLLDDKAISDSGIILPQEDGLLLEKGSMPNPETGKETEYEEVWEALPITLSAGLDHEYCALTHDQPTEDRAGKSRGFIVQLGIWFQAILRIDRHDAEDNIVTEFRAVRWKWEESREAWSCLLDDKTGAWKLPTPFEVANTLKSSRVTPGAKVDIKRRQWLCNEVKRTGSASS